MLFNNLRIFTGMLCGPAKPNISPGAYIFQRPFLRGLFLEGNLRFKIDWASLIVRCQLTIFALFDFVFEGNFPSTSPLRGVGGGVLYLEG